MGHYCVGSSKEIVASHSMNHQLFHSNGNAIPSAVEIDIVNKLSSRTYHSNFSCFTKESVTSGSFSWKHNQLQVIHKCFTIWSLQNLCLLLRVSFALRLGFTSTHNTIRLLLHGNSSWSKAGTRPFKAVAVLKSWELLLSQLRQFFLLRLLPFSLEPCQICLKGLEWEKNIVNIFARRHQHRF